MKALILASGKGSRLKPLTDNTSKSLVKINGKTLLERIIDSLVSEKVNEIIITTGFLGEKIEKFVKEKYPLLKVSFVLNSKYETTNYIYSMWLAKDFLKDNDILYFHSDVFFDTRLLEPLIKSTSSSCLINSDVHSEKDFNARIEDGKIKEINVKLTDVSTKFCLPIYKLLKNDFQIWIENIDKFIGSDKCTCYAEIALNEVLNDINLIPSYFNKEIGMEIDDFDDLAYAEKLSKGEINDGK